MEKKSIAVFDFDGVITNKDSFLAFIRFTHKTSGLIGCFWANKGVLWKYFRGQYPNFRLKEDFFTYCYKGWPEEKLRALGDQFGAEKIPTFYRPEVQKKIAWHKEQGHDLYLLTASSDIWLAKWASDQGFRLIGTRFEVKNGVFTGKIAGKNCFGEEKRIRLQTEVNLADYEKSYGYADSPSDQYFMDLVDEEVWV